MGVHTNSENLINNSNYSDQTRQMSTEEYKAAKKTIDVPILIEGYAPQNKEAIPTSKYSPPTFQSAQKESNFQPKHGVSPLHKSSPSNFPPSPKEATPVNKYSSPSYPFSSKEATPMNKYSPPTYSTPPKEATPMNKYSPPSYPSPPKGVTPVNKYSPPTFPSPP